MQLSFAQELADLITAARANGSFDDLVLRDAIAQSWIELQIMRYNCLRSLRGDAHGAPVSAASISKLYWSQWFQRFGELSLRVRGASGMVAAAAGTAADGTGPPSAFDATQQLLLFGRAVTIFAGSSEIQRNILGESVLGLPREPR
jgi:alkylation response protein AidB-like acyl-CoA dehydrogenase